MLLNRTETIKTLGVEMAIVLRRALVRGTAAAGRGVMVLMRPMTRRSCLPRTSPLLPAGSGNREGLLGLRSVASSVLRVLGRPLLWALNYGTGEER